MTEPNPSLTTLTALKAYLQISGEAHDDLLDSLIQAVSAQFAAHIGRNLAARAYSPDPASLDYDPDNAPPGGTASAGYLLDRAAGVLSLAAGVFPRGRANVLVAYRAGFEPIPLDLAQAALEQTAVRFQESAAGQGRLGVSARTLADGSLSYAAGALLPQVAAVLERYRTRSLL